jgi:hypothetical protein
MYVATINTPGYLPMDDEPPIFDSPRDAWEYLAEERKRAEEDTDPSEYDDGDPDQFELSDVYRALEHLASAEHVDGDLNGTHPTDPDGTGVVYGHAPGRRNAPHDLGYAYCVSIADDEYAAAYLAEHG